MDEAPGTRSARREATRQRVLDAARDVFAERGVIGGTVEEICTAAGFTRGAFYSNFPDKVAIVRELLVSEEERLLAVLDENFSLPEPGDGQPPDPAETLGAVAAKLLATIPVERRFSLIKTEMEINAIRDPEIAAEFRLMDQRFRDRVEVFLVRGLRRLGLELIVDPADATDAAICLFERSARRALLEGPDADPNALANAVVPYFLAAVSRVRPGGTDGAAPVSAVLGAGAEGGDRNG